MSRWSERTGEALRARGATIAVVAVLGAAAVMAVRWIASQRSDARQPRKVMQFTVVSVQPAPPPRPPPPPPTQAPPPRQLDDPEPSRVELKAVDIPPPDAPPPPPGEPAAGPLALAAAGDGPGDAFNLAGNPGGRGLLTGGGLGDGSGGGGVGPGDAEARRAWYYGKMVPDIEAILRRNKRLASSPSAVVELRLWWDQAGRITRVQPILRGGDDVPEEAFTALVGTPLSHPPPPDVPMPVVQRIRIRRPQ